MSNQRLKDAAQAVATVQNVPFPGKRQEAIATAVLAVVDQPVMIDADEAHDLPPDSVIISEQGGFWFHEGDGFWLTPGQRYRVTVDDLTFPAQLVRRGDA